MSIPMQMAPWLIATALVGCPSGAKPGSGASNASVVPAARAPSASAPAASAQRVDPDQVPRIAPAEAHRRVAAGQALLVCAYDNDEKYQRNKLAGSISFNEFQQRLPALGKDQEIILYCS